MKLRASLLGWMGAVALAFALISFVIQLVSGGGALLWSELWFTLANLAAGVVLVAVAAASSTESLRARLRSGEARRVGRYGTSALLASLLGLALLGMAAFLSTRYHERWDLTEARTHSLSDQTHKLLAGLAQPVQVTALYAQVEAAAAKALLERYQLAAPDKVQVEFLNPQQQPGRLRALGIATERLEGGLLHVKVGSESTEVKDLTEEALTNAIVKLTRRSGSKKVYFLIGHNERTIEEKAKAEGSSMTFAADALAKESYEVSPLLLGASADVPSDASVVVLAGPTRPYHESEHAALERYLARGGAVLVMIDPAANTDIVPDLAKWGVAVGDDVVVDLREALNGRPYTPFAAQYGDHPITRELREAALFNTVRSIRPVEGAAGGLAPIVMTGEASWAETDFKSLGDNSAQPGEGELVGAVPIAVAGEAAIPPAEGAKRARLVVIGDSDFATNQLFNEYRNRDVFLNSVNWLLGDVEAISIRPAVSRATRLSLTSEQFLQIRYLSLFVLPEAIALLGVVAWWRRRRAPGR